MDSQVSEAGKYETTTERTSGRELVVTRTFDGPARHVFKAWTTPELLKRWWAPKSIGITLVSCEVDARTGGTYRFEFGVPGSDQPAAYLPAHWEEATRQFERDIYVGTARVRANERGRRKLSGLSDTVREAIDAVTLTPDAEGWAEFDVPIEEAGWASFEFVKIGDDVEVLSPPELRERVVATVQKMARLYRVSGH